jgi:hypothetical protein
MKMIKLLIIFATLIANSLSFRRKRSVTGKSKAYKKLSLKSSTRSSLSDGWNSCNFINSANNKESASNFYYGSGGATEQTKGVIVSGDLCNKSWTTRGSSNDWCYIPYRTIKESITYTASTDKAKFPSTDPATFEIYLATSDSDSATVVSGWNTKRSERRTLIANEIAYMKTNGTSFFTNFNSFNETIFKMWNSETKTFAQTDVAEKQVEIKKYDNDTIAKQTQIVELQKVLVKNVYEKNRTNTEATIYQTVVNDINSRIKANVEGYAVVESADTQLTNLQSYITWLKTEVPELTTTWEKIETLTKAGSDYVTAIEYLVSMQIYA